jgi:hypothetical protein
VGLENRLIIINSQAKCCFEHISIVKNQQFAKFPFGTLLNLLGSKRALGVLNNYADKHNVTVFWVSQCLLGNMFFQNFFV